MKYKLFLVSYYGKDGFAKRETRVALSKEHILQDFGNKGYYMNVVDVTELENEVIVYIDIKDVVVH